VAVVSQTAQISEPVEKHSTIIQVLDVDTARARHEPLQLTGRIGDASLDPTLRWASVGRLNEHGQLLELEIWHLATGRLVQRHNVPERDRFNVASHSLFSRDGTRLVIRGGDELRVWETATGQPVGPPWLLPGYLVNVAFDRTGDRLMTVHAPWQFQPMQVHIWDVRAGRPLVELPIQLPWLASVDLSADGSRIVTTHNSHDARVWDAVTGKPLTPLLRHRHHVANVSFGPDDRAVITLGGSGQVQLWDAATGEPLTLVLGGDTLQHLVGSAHVVAPDGRLLTLEQVHGWTAAVRQRDLRRDNRSIDVLRLLAQVLSGHRIDETGDYVRLTDEQFAEVWQRLQGGFPQAQLTTAEHELAWHAAHAHRCEQAGRLADAVDHLTAQIDAQPHRWRLWHRRARAYAGLNQLDKAVADLTAAIERDAEDPNVWNDRGHYRAETGRFREAAGDFAQVGDQATQALALLAAGDRDGYRKVRGRLLEGLPKLESHPGTLSGPLWPCVLPAADAADLKPLLSVLEAALPRASEYDQWQMLGLALLRLGKPAEAEQQLQQALKRLEELRTFNQQKDWPTGWLEKEYARAWLILALIQHRAGRPAETRKWYDKAAGWLDQPGRLDKEDWGWRLHLRLLRTEAQPLMNPKK
jgi:tetratricopeptide (TPR) repeat protein